MRSNSSKPSSDAGLRPFGYSLTIDTHTAHESQDALSGGLSFFDRQTAAANQPGHLTGRHKAPTGVPTSTQVLVGGEETPSRAVVANQGVSSSQRMARPALVSFSEQTTDQDKVSRLPLPTVKASPYSTGLKPEAVDKLPPIEAHRILSKPAPQMSEAAEHFHMLKMRLDHCLSDRQYDDLVYSTECRLREQAAYLIGYLV
jgi:hypothetical protein